jgi:hypothetical protein
MIARLKRRFLNTTLYATFSFCLWCSMKVWPSGQSQTRNLLHLPTVVFERNRSLSNQFARLSVPFTSHSDILFHFLIWPGDPKGIQRPSGGHAVALPWSMDVVFDVKPEEVWWAASDLGWVVGHSYICYGPLLRRLTSVVYEGKPVGTPDAGQFFRFVKRIVLKNSSSCPVVLTTDLRSAWICFFFSPLVHANHPVDYRCETLKMVVCCLCPQVASQPQTLIHFPAVKRAWSWDKKLKRKTLSIMSSMSESHLWNLFHKTVRSRDSTTLFIICQFETLA